MNKRIKEIDINAFRAYKDMQKFNFIHNETGKVADLVTIYAPNGYGKTSFFDAVEWAITDKIGRLGSGLVIKEELSEEKNYVLKNRDSNADYGSVKIIDEDDKVIHVNTKKKTGRMKGDYKAGEIERISPELQGIWNEKDTFCTTNLLAHDKITTFLQSYTAEGKTSELRVMWDEDNYSEILDVIVELYSELDKKRKQLILDIKREDKELGKYEYENDQVLRINKLISDYADIYGIKTVPNNAELLSQVDSVLKEFYKLHEQTQCEKEKTEDDQGANELLLQGYSLFSDNRNTVQLKNEQKKEAEKAIEIWELIEKDVQKREVIDKDLQDLSNALIQIKDFYQCLEKINANEKELAVFEKTKSVLEKDKIKADGEIQEIRCVVKNNEDSIKKLQDGLAELRQDVSKYIINQKSIVKYKNLDTKARVILEQRDRRTNKLLSNISSLEMFLEGKSDIEKICNFVSERVVDEYNAIQKLKEDKSILLENIETLESNRKNIIVLLDKMQQLIIQGKDIVTERNQSECPLCHMKYRDSEELIKKIEDDKGSEKELQRTDNQIQKNKEKLTEIECSIKEMEQDVNDKISGILIEYNEKYSEEKRKKNRLLKTIEEHSYYTDNLQNLCKSIEEKYLEQGITISNANEVISYEEKIQKDKEGIKECVEKELTQIENIKKKMEEIDKSVIDYNLKILVMNEQNTKLKKEPLYISVEQFLEKSKLSYQEKSYVEMNEILVKIYDSLSRQIKELDSEVEKYKAEVVETKENYQSKLNILIKEINELNINIEDYILRYKNIIGKFEKDEDIFPQITEKKDEFENRLKVIREKLQSENRILSSLGNLKEQKMWLDRKQACELNKTKLEFLNQRIEKLEESKKFVEEFVVKKTNEYFNSDIINQIYNKIDPHPTMKHIKFDTLPDGKKGLRTHIYTYDDSENNTMSPVLYLSSAQVNILSLCIFLAKVLSEKNTTFNTIFMDDPIQHLDGINLLAFIDVLRTITTKMGRQIIISTHNEQFYNLLKVKMDERYYSSKFIVLSSAGVIAR
ncbi:MAG: AAA family ATPase [Lachnospiraceae bacterium]|nr:AAA family ATPase [Lachnospiraceae bacterium]